MINTKLIINNTEYKAESINFEKSVSDFNTSSNFKIVFNNYNGDYDDVFALNEEVEIYADKDVAATTQVFLGIIEKIDYKGSKMNEKLTLTGRDYTAVLQDLNIQPNVFRNIDVGDLVKVLVESTAKGVVTTNNVARPIGVELPKISYSYKSVYDALRELAEIAEYYFYIDEDKDLHFVPRDSISSGLTFDNTNITRATFKTDDKTIFNKVWVYGDTLLSGVNEQFNAETIYPGSVYTLTDKPHNMRVYLTGSIQQYGGVLDFVGAIQDTTDPNNPQYASGLSWLMNYDQKQFCFVSGTAAGDNIPTTGSLSIDYDRATTIARYKQDVDSIVAYGPKEKVISNNEIKDFLHAGTIATSFLSDNKDPKIQGDLDIYGVLVMNAGETAVINIPFHNVVNQTYKILSAKYKFNTLTCSSDQVLHITLNKKISDFTDTLKDQMLRLRQIEMQNIGGVLTRLETKIELIPVQRHYEVYTQGIGSAFILHHPINGFIESSNSLIGEMRDAQVLFASGGDF